MNSNSKVISNFEDIPCILLDIEGTSTSIDFVRKVLFPYGEKHIANYVKDHWNEYATQKVVLELLHQNIIERIPALASDHSCDGNFLQEQYYDIVIEKLLDQMKQGKRSKAIKELEGLVWKNGYIDGNLVGHVYPDVVDAFDLWKRLGKEIFIYSNGCVESQKLLFKYSCFGDLTKFIDKNFDTNVGSKLEPSSYTKICEETKRSSKDFIFLSDHPQELFAAKQSGMKIVLVIRDPDHMMFQKELNYLEPCDPRINSFSEIEC